MPATDNPNAGSASTIFPITSKPGIQRDGTQFDSDSFVDGQWCRFQRGRPKKMGGYRMVTNQFDGPIRTTFVHATANNNRVYCGSGSNLQFTDLTPSGVGGGISDVTPTLANGFVPSNYNTWQFAELYDAVSTSSRLIAHAAPNLSSIDSTARRKIWYGDIDGSTPLVVAGDAPEVCGGVLAAAPYALAMCDNGYIAWCVPNEPDDWTSSGSGSARITRSKLVYGSPVRGGAGQAPAIVLWSLDAVLRGTFSGGSTVFDFDTITSQSSILSSAGVIEYDGIFFWAGVDRFLMYNGVVQEVPNTFNINYFFDNLNWNQRQKVWATKIPRYGEIWWHYPSGNSVECNAAIVFNIRENVWYDTSVERTSGYYPQVFRWPLWTDVQPSDTALVRPSSGTPATSDGGTVANAFDGDPATACTQIGTDGDISYDYGSGVTKPISRVGILPNGDATYDLVFEYSDDNAATWTTAVAPGSTAYTDQVAVFYDLPTPISARAWRVRETDGGTLDLAEVYFMAYGYMLMQHEFGRNRIVGSVQTSIRSYIETGTIDYVARGPLGDRWLGVNRQIMLRRIEPDLIQSGPMTVSVIGQRYARDNDVTQTFDMAQVTGDANDLNPLKLDLTQQFRLMRLRFQSDTLDGFFEMGEITLMIGPGDASA